MGECALGAGRVMFRVQRLLGDDDGVGGAFWGDELLGDAEAAQPHDVVPAGNDGPQFTLSAGDVFVGEQLFDLLRPGGVLGPEAVARTPRAQDEFGRGEL